jgi:protein-L-isoaspartate(D-aspartate) O-methyltransferase
MDMKWCATMVIGVVLGLAYCGCSRPPNQEAANMDWTGPRAAMLETLRRHGVRDERILAAMASVRRDRYIPEAFRRDDAYGDHPLPIGHGQTISQPFVVAYMTWKMNFSRGEKVLEIGTGSGYQAAILAELGLQVYSIEIVPELADHARRALTAEGYRSVEVLTGNGYKGWPKHAPFDAIIVTCAPTDIPPVLVHQLRDGGRMILPVGRARQRLIILRKKGVRIIQEEDLPVRFVPMVKAADY